MKQLGKFNFKLRCKNLFLNNKLNFFRMVLFIGAVVYISLGIIYRSHIEMTDYFRFLHRLGGAILLLFLFFCSYFSQFIRNYIKQFIYIICYFEIGYLVYFTWAEGYSVQLLFVIPGLLVVYNLIFPPDKCLKWCNIISIFLVLGSVFFVEIEINRFFYSLVVVAMSGGSYLLTLLQYQNKQKLNFSQQRYANLFANMVNGFAYHELVTDEQGKPVDYIFQEVNQAFEELTGLQCKEIIGRKVTEVLPEIDKQWIEIYGEIALNGKQEFFKHYSKPLDKWYKVSAYSFQPGFFATIFIDITDQKELEEQLRRKTDEQQLLLNNIETQVWYLTDPITYGKVNQAHANFLGLAKEEVEGQNVYTLLTEAESEVCEESNGQVFINKQSVTTQEWAQNYQGEQRLLSITKTPKLDQQGEVEYVVCSAEDITERQLAQQELKKAYDKLEQNIKRARKVHQQFLPKQFPAIAGLQFDSYYQPAADIGGDFYNVIRIADKIVFYLIDITGHGVDGALLSVFVRETINNHLLMWQNDHFSLTANQIVHYLAQEFRKEDFPDDYFVSLMVGVLDIDSREVEICNAGMQSLPQVADKKGVNLLTETNLPISTAVSSEFYQLSNLKNQSFILTPGTEIFLTTDGLLEEEKDTEIYGQDRIKELLEENYYLEPKVLSNLIKVDLQQFNGKERSDDISWLIIKSPAEVIEEEQIKLTSRLEAIEQAKQQVDDFLAPYSRDRDLLLMAVHEIVANAVEHGNNLAADKKVIIDIKITDDYIELVVSDQGSGFNWQTNFKDKDKDIFDLNNFAERGRGLVIACDCCDQLCYNESGNQVYLYQQREELPAVNSKI